MDSDVVAEILDQDQVNYNFNFSDSELDEKKDEGDADKLDVECKEESDDKVLTGTKTFKTLNENSQAFRVEALFAAEKKTREDKDRQIKKNIATGGALSKIIGDSKRFSLTSFRKSLDKKMKSSLGKKPTRRLSHTNSSSFENPKEIVEQKISDMKGKKQKYMN